MNQLIAALKESDQDFEYYPTTNEIIAKLISDITTQKCGNYNADKLRSFLDIGAGNGKVIDYLRAARVQLYGSGSEAREIFDEFYAIEKSTLLCQQLHSSVFIIGTEFHEQSLVSKEVSVTFCNPPYSEFTEWASKIIRESASLLVYLVIPRRWQDSLEISAALEYRGAKSEIVGEFTFEDAEDRKARAKVHLLRIRLSSEKDDAFDRFFDEQFADLKKKFEVKKGMAERDESFATNYAKDGNPKFRSLVAGQNLPERMVTMYNEELDHIRKNYDLVGQLDADLLREFDVTPARILGCLKARLAGLRNTYWKELFTHMSQVTDRLTTDKRRIILEKLQRSGHVDFTLSNINAVIIWVLKNANSYLDEQLIGTFETMVEKANVRNYKSNQRPFGEDRWRYAEEKPSHIALEFRIVLERVGGISKHGMFSDRGLNNRAGEFIGDLLTVARNLGFSCQTCDPRLLRYSQDSGLSKWASGKTEVFDIDTDGEPLVEAKAFYNGNMHLRLNQKFALALNVEYGRLKGWLKSGAQAVDELNEKDAEQFFSKNLQLGQNSLTMLAAPAPLAAVA